MHFRISEFENKRQFTLIITYVGERDIWNLMKFKLIITLENQCENCNMM